MRPGICYQAARLINQTRGLEYVEGLLIVPAAGREVVLPHAWNVTRAGEVVDTTPAGTITGARYEPVRYGTELTIAELDERGNPTDLVHRALHYGVHRCNT